LMAGSRVDTHALQFVVVFTGNMLVGFIDRSPQPAMRLTGTVLLVAGAALFFYVIAYLRGGLLGSTEPVLDHLVTGGPYRFCWHPLYLCFLMMLLGASLYMGSWVSVAYTFLLSVPSAAYRAAREDVLLRERFGGEWEAYAGKAGMFLPRLGQRS